MELIYARISPVMVTKKLKKYYIWPIGCAQNISDAERVAAVLESMGYTFISDEKEADIICTLACSVRQTAIDRIYGRSKHWKKYDKKPIKVLSGCVLPQDKPKMEKIFDITFEIKDLKNLPDLLRSKVIGSRIRENEKYFEYLSIRPKHNSTFQALVPIMNGCNNFCSYCAVPYTRGRETSRPSKEIIEEIKDLVEKGYKEITLLGQNVNSYGIRSKDHGTRDNDSFLELLKELNDIPGKFWIRFYSNHPKDFPDELIAELPKLKKINPCIHLPLQSGSDKILKAMNRKYTSKQFIELAEKIKENIPGVAIETDTIVGFPGETKEDFEDTVEVYKKVKFDMAYIAMYSPRKGTISEKTMKDDISKEEKKKRFGVLTEILKETALANNQRYLNKEITVLIEKSHKSYLWGHTDTFKNVKLKGSNDLIGTFQKAKIVNVKPFVLEGQII